MMKESSEQQLSSMVKIKRLEINYRLNKPIDFRLPKRDPVEDRCRSKWKSRIAAFSCNHKIFKAARGLFYLKLIVQSEAASLRP